MALRTKETKDRSLALSSGMTALVGITEPVLYGVNLPKKYPLVAAMIGGCGGLYAGLTHTHRFATGSSGLPAVLLYIGDETFAAGVLGQGVGVIPSEGVVKAPFSGTISSVADSKHAIGLESPDSMEQLIHVGVNTVDMNGKGFMLKVKEGDTVTAGQELMTFDRKAIAEAGHPDIVVVLLTNSEDYENVTAAPAGPVMAGTEIIHI